MMTDEARAALFAGKSLLAASLAVLIDFDVEEPRPRTEEELTVMQVMIANAQATAAVAEFLYAASEPAP